MPKCRERLSGPPYKWKYVSSSLTLGTTHTYMFNLDDARDLDEVIEYAVDEAPSLFQHNGPTKYFAWADTVVPLIAFIYSEDPDSIMEKLTRAVKKNQDYEDDEEEDDDEDAT